MKSFSQFNNLVEIAGDEVVPGNVKKGEAFKKKIAKILKQSVPTKDADPWDDKNFDQIERDAKGKKGEEIRKTVEKQSKNIDKGNKALVDRVNDKSGNRPPNVKKGELGKLYKSGTDEFGSRQGSTRTNSKINQELQAKRTARINPTTGKATQKGVENFAINKLTKGLSTKGPTGREQLDNAKKLASNPNSAAYKDIENKINTSDYAGKRAKLASADELKKIKTDIKTSKTIDAKVDTGRGSKAPTNIKTKTTKTPLNTSTRKGKITYLGNKIKRAKLASADELKKINTDIKTSKTINAKVDVGKTSKAPTNIKAKTTKTSLNTSTRQGRITYLWKKIKPTSKSSSTPNLNPDQVLRQNLGASGMDSNVPGSQPITKSTTKPTITKPTGKGFYTGGKHQTPGGTNVTSNLSSNNTKIPTAKTTNVSGKSFDQFKTKSNVAKLKVTPKNLAGRVTGPAFAAWNAIDNYNAAKGSPLRKAVKSAITTTAYYKGFTGGAALGTAGGSFTGPGAFVTGTAGGILGGNLAQKTAGSLFNKVWKPPTTKTKTSTNNSSVGGTNGKDKTKKYTATMGGIRLGQ